MGQPYFLNDKMVFNSTDKAIIDWTAPIVDNVIMDPDTSSFFKYNLYYTVVDPGATQISFYGKAGVNDPAINDPSWTAYVDLTGVTSPKYFQTVVPYRTFAVKQKDPNGIEKMSNHLRHTP